MYGQFSTPWKSRLSATRSRSSFCLPRPGLKTARIKTAKVDINRRYLIGPGCKRRQRRRSPNQPCGLAGPSSCDIGGPCPTNMPTLCPVPAGRMPPLLVVEPRRLTRKSLAGPSGRAREVAREPTHHAASVVASFGRMSRCISHYCRAFEPGGSHQA